ncbi:Uncharacterized protein HZ326_13015 [Fusarium oxysporum f. sp. albedinis]|nr:Uncharacterized protein HZ326_13015 [Fusarium oxysporum f. sp. albedinis]
MYEPIESFHDLLAATTCLPKTYGRSSIASKVHELGSYPMPKRAAGSCSSPYFYVCWRASGTLRLESGTISCLRVVISAYGFMHEQWNTGLCCFSQERHPSISRTDVLSSKEPAPVSIHVRPARYKTESLT